MQSKRFTNFIIYITQPFFTLKFRKKLETIVLILTIAGSIWGIFNLLNFTLCLKAIVIYSLLLLLLLWSYHFLYKENIKIKNRVSDFEGKAIGNLEHLYLCASKIIGISKDSYDVKTDINPDGSMNAKYIITLSAISKDIDFIDHFASLKYKDPEIKEKMELIGWEKETNGIKITPIIEEITDTTLFWKMQFIPAIQVGQLPLEYYFEYKTPKKSFAINKKELQERKLPSEYFLVRINYPTKKLTYRITFDRTIDPSNLTYDVWIGRSDIRNFEEYERVKKNKMYKIGREPNGNVYIILGIEYPILSLSYVIKWDYQR